MRSPILNTLVNSLSSAGLPAKSAGNGGLTFLTSVTSYCFPGPNILNSYAILRASRRYRPAVLLHQFSIAESDRPTAQIPSFLDILVSATAVNFPTRKNILRLIRASATKRIAVVARGQQTVAELILRKTRLVRMKCTAKLHGAALRSSPWFHSTFPVTA